MMPQKMRAPADELRTTLIERGQECGHICDCDITVFIEVRQLILIQERNHERGRVEEVQQTVTIQICGTRDAAALEHRELILVLRHNRDIETLIPIEVSNHGCLCAALDKHALRLLEPTEAISIKHAELMQQTTHNVRVAIMIQVRDEGFAW